MARIVFLTMYDRSNRPCYAYIKSKSFSHLYELYRPGIKKPIKAVKKSINNIREFLIKASDDGHKIITTDFKSIIKYFDLPIDDREYSVYDIHLNNINSTDNYVKDVEFIKRAADRLLSYEVVEYQKLLANASIVYQDLENNGLLINDILVKPEWSLQTYSGRSKSLGFNIQGYSEGDHISTVTNDHQSVLLHFDWISADLRAASLLSNDDKLKASFSESDPYSVLMEHINSNSEGNMDREECKLFLLKSINSMDTNQIIMDVYPQLCGWIHRIQSVTNNKNGCAESLLHRRFKVASAKNSLAVLNGAMQGTVAHAMHNVMRQVWLKCGRYIVADIHDSLVLSVPKDHKIINSVIDSVVSIMVQPFKGYTEQPEYFPVKISIGKKWKKWKLIKTVRDIAYVDE